MQGPKDKSYETKEWEFGIIDVSAVWFRTVRSWAFINSKYLEL